MREPPIRIVLVDDVDALRRLVRKALEFEGLFAVVGEAGDGLAGVEEVHRAQPDVVLLDLSMPRMDGLEALPRICEAAPAARVVVFSGFAESRLARAALGMGAVGYVEKGASPAELRRRLQAIANAHRAGGAPSREEAGR